MTSNFDFLFLTVQPGLLVVDIPANSSFLAFAISVFLVVFLVNFVLRLIKLIPFV